jgi:type I restriction enzyme S subunit
MSSKTAPAKTQKHAASAGASAAIPRLRFPGFKGGWGREKLGSIADVTSSKRVYESDYVPSGIPFFRGKEISELKRGEKPSDVLYINESKFSDFKCKFGAPAQGDILITSVGTLGNIYRVNTSYDFYFKDGNLIWLKNLTVDSAFLETVIDFSKAELLRGVIGSTQKALTIDGIKKVELSFPVLAEQQKIASFLTTVDLWIDNLRSQKSELESYKRGMMQKLFSQQIRFRDGNGNEYPEWEEKRLADIFEISAGSSKSEYIANFGKNIIVDMGGISTDAKLIAKKYTDYSDDFLTTNDLVMPKDDIGGGLIIGKAARIPEDNKYIFGDHIFKLTKRQGDISFLFYSVNSFEINISFRKKANGTAQLGLSKGAVENQKIPFPSLPEQKKIAEILISVDQLIESKQHQINLALEWKKGLMQGLFI